MKKFQKITVIVLAFIMLFSLLPVSAAENDLSAEVIEKFNAMDSLSEMQSKRADYSEAEAYEAYVVNMHALRAEALEIYAGLTDAQKTQLENAIGKDALSDKLATQLNNVMKPITTNVVKGEEGYQFFAVFPRNRAYEVSTHLNDGGHPMTIILVDTENIEGSWTVDSEYAYGESDYEVLYCCEIQQPVIHGTHYRRINLEDAEYYDDEAAAHIRAITKNVYPYVSLEEMKQNLKADGFEYADELDRGDIISAVQFAIWHYSNEEYAYVEGMDAYGSTINIDNLSYASALHNYSNELWSWWKLGKNATCVDESARVRTDALVQYLINLEPEYADTEKIVISSVEILGAEPVQKNGNAYNTSLKVKLNSGALSEEDSVNIIVSRTDAQGNETQVASEKVQVGKDTYNFIVEANNNDTLNVTVEGKQTLPKSVYLYYPDCGKENSQVLCGVAEGSTNVYSAASAVLEIKEVKVTADLLVEKVNSLGNYLAGAGFTLSLVKDNETFEVGSYVANELGQFKVENLVPGNYVLEETLVPEGYAAPETPVEFTVNEEGKVDIKDSAYASLNGNTLTVVNNFKPVTAVIEAEKYLDGAPAGGFDFVLSKGGVAYETVTSTEDGKITFSPISFNTVGKYNFELKEVAGQREDIVYDNTVYSVTVKVENLGNSLTATVEYLKNGEAFEGPVKFNNETALFEIPDEDVPLADGQDKEETDTQVKGDSVEKEEVKVEKEENKEKNPSTSDDPFTALFFAAVSLATAVGATMIKKRRED